MVHPNHNDDDNDRPIERSARKPPRAAAASAVAVPRKARAVDPRFDSMYGSLDKRQFQQNYKFLEEQRDEEQTLRLRRIKQLHALIRRHQLEQAAEGNADELDELNLSDVEEEAFLDGVAEDDAVGRSRALHELSRMRRLPVDMIHEELLQLKRQSTLYRSQVGDAKAKDRSSEVKKRMMKEEVKAVKDGKKLAPYFPKRSDVKKQIVEERFDHLNARGGKLMVDKYVGRKRSSKIR